MLSPQPTQQPQQSAGYNGTVSVEGKSVQVSGGIAEFDGEKYYVSDDGSMVVDGQRNVIGYVESGQFNPIDKPHLDLLKSKGYLE